MDRVLRIIGVTLVAGVGLWAYGVFDRSVAAEPPSEPTTAPAESAQPGLDAGSDLQLDLDLDPDLVPGLGADAEAGAGAAVDPDPSLSDPGPEVDRASGTAGPADADGEPPRYLVFDPGLEARFYRVASSSASLASLTPAVDDYPVETDLFPRFSLADNGLIEPGLYASDLDARECNYELRRLNPKGPGDRLIGHERLADGRLLVSIDTIEPDVFRSSPGCGSWARWSPLARPLVSAANGDYWSGDLARGVWAVPPGCLWEKVIAFRGARLVDVVESARGPVELLIDQDTLGVRLRDCDDLVRLAQPEPGSGFDLGNEPGLQP